MKITFETCVRITLKEEGGFQKDPGDSGNWTGGKIGKGILKGTKYGISAASYPTLDIKNLTIERATDIYRSDFWDRLRADELPEFIRMSIFDMAVTAGVAGAIRVLQLAVKVAQNGKLDSITIREAKFLGLDEFTEARKEYYRGVVERKPEKKKYLNGWLNRADNVAKLTKELISVVTG